MNNTRLSRWHVVVEEVPPGYDEFMSSRIRDYMAEADTQTQAESQALAAIPYGVSAAATLIDHGTFRREYPAACSTSPEAVRARDRFIGSRMMEIMRDEGIGAVPAYERAVDELEGRAWKP